MRKYIEAVLGVFGIAVLVVLLDRPLKKAQELGALLAEKMQKATGMISPEEEEGSGNNAPS